MVKVCRSNLCDLTSLSRIIGNVRLERERWAVTMADGWTWGVPGAGGQELAPEHLTDQTTGIQRALSSISFQSLSLRWACEPEPSLPGKASKPRAQRTSEPFERLLFNSTKKICMSFSPTWSSDSCLLHSFFPWRNSELSSSTHYRLYRNWIESICMYVPILYVPMMWRWASFPVY